MEKERDLEPCVEVLHTFFASLIDTTSGMQEAFISETGDFFQSKLLNDVDFLNNIELVNDDIM